MKDTDIVPSLLSVGEHVINRGAVDLVGGQSLAKLNSVGRQIMNNNPQRYNKPDGIDQSVPPRLGARFDKGNGVQGNMPGLAGVVKNGNSYRQAPGFVPANTVRTATGIYPQRYQDGTLNNSGVQKPDRMKAYNDAFNARGNDPAYVNYLHKMAGGNAAKADSEYSKYLKMKHFQPDGYQDGTTRPEGIRPLNGPSFFDTIKSYVMPPEVPVNPVVQPVKQGYVPTIDEARKNYELQPSSMPVQKYAYGTLNPEGIPIDTYPVDPKRFGFQGVASNKQVIPTGHVDNGYRPNWTHGNQGNEEILTKFDKLKFTPGESPEAMAFKNRPAYETAPKVDSGNFISDGLKGFGKGFVASEILDAGRRGLYNALPKSTASNVLGAGISGLMGDTDAAKQMLFGQPVDNAPPLTRLAIDSLSNKSNNQEQKKTAQATITPNPQAAPKLAADIGPGNIDMNKVPSRISDAGLPYNAVGNTVNFTNADGSGQGSISERMPVNGGLRARMNDGKGSLSVMKLESPYGPGGKPPELGQPQQPQYATNPVDYTGYIDDLNNRLDMNQPDGKFDSIGTLIGKKQANRQTQGQIDLLSGLQQANQQNALGRDQLAQNQGQFDARYGLDRAQFDQGVRQQDFANQLGLADIGIKSKANEANAKKANMDMAINAIKAAPQFHQSKMLQLLTEAINSGAVDDPKTQQIAKIYQMAFGKNPMDDLFASMQQQ